MADGDTLMNQKTYPSCWVAGITLIGIIALISVGLVVFHIDLQYLMDAALILAVISACIATKYSLLQVVKAMLASVWEARMALLIFVLMGALIASLIMSGSVAALVDLGVSILQPRWFLPAALIVASLMSIATGTAWGTAATAGVVLMGIGTAMGLPLPVVAGAVVSGACFGDKMSVVSDTTNLAAMSSRVPIYRHVRSMLYTTVPAYLIVLVAYTLVGLSYDVHAMPYDDIATVKTALSSTYHLGIICFLPLLWLVVQSIRKVTAPRVMAESILIGLFIAWWYQDMELSSALVSLWQGSTVHTGVESLDGLLGRGGITSMYFTIAISLKALMLGGILSRMGYIRVVVARALSSVRRYGSLVSITILSAITGNLLMGEAYMSIVLGGELFRKKYDDEQVSRTVLSRCLEEGATLTTPLIPWTTAGVFFATTLGVATLDYLPYAWLNLVNPLIGIVFGYLGWARMTSHVSQAADE